MATFLSGHQRIFWDLLYTTGLWAITNRIEDPSDHTITLVSPWITDISTEGSGWPEELATQACNTNSNLGSLKSVLIALAHLGFNIRLVTMAAEGKWMEKPDNRMLQNESSLFTTLHQHGMTCQIRQSMHYKWLCTPVGLWKGSSNATANGLFGRLEEQNDVFYSIDDDRYHTQKEILERAINLSADYFVPGGEIADVGVAMAYAARTTQQQNLVFQSAEDILPHQPLNIGNYPEFTPLDYSPIGQIDEGVNELNPAEKRSMEAWVNSTVSRLISLVDFVYTKGSHLIEINPGYTWIDAIIVRDLEGQTHPLSESDREERQDDIEHLTTHEILSRIVDKFLILQCCGLAVNEAGQFCPSDGFDANGNELTNIFKHVLMEYVPMEQGAAESIINNLFNLVYSLTHFICMMADSEDHYSQISTDLANCIRQLEEYYLRPVEQEF